MQELARILVLRFRLSESQEEKLDKSEGLQTQEERPARAKKRTYDGVDLAVRRPTELGVERDGIDLRRCRR